MRKTVITAALLVLFSATPLFAQEFDPLVFGTNLSVGVVPQYPRAGDRVHLTATGNGLDLSGSKIVWYANGKILTQGQGVVSADVIAGTLGSETDIELDVISPDGSTRTAQATVAPAEIDLLTSSDSYVPPFYLGRALPSAGTNLLVQALARLKRADGTLIPDSDITFTWKDGSQVLGSLSGRGKSSATIPVTHLFTSEVVTVTAESSDGTRSAQATVVVPSADPAITLYEDHPLYGILFNNALGASTNIPDSEMAFAAIPYFAQASSANDPALSFTWTVNDARVSSSASSPSELTINADNSTGQAQVALEITDSKSFYMDSRRTWNIFFSNSGNAGDSFHTSQ